MTGCTNDVSLDLEKIKTELIDLEEDKFAPSQLYQLDTSKYFNETEEIYDLTEYNIDSSNVDYMQGIKSTDNDYFYLVIKPTKDNADKIKNSMNEYLNKLDETKIKVDEYEEYIIYVYSDNSTELLKEIKTAKAKVLPSLMEVNKDSIKDILEIEDKWIDEILMMQPLMNVNASQFIIIKPASGYKDKIKDKVDAYMNALEEQWKTYLPDQYELVKKRKEEKIGNYLVYIISGNNELIYNTIKKNEVK